MNFNYLLIHDTGVVIDPCRQILPQTEMILCGGGFAVNGILEVYRVDASLAAVAVANEQELFVVLRKQLIRILRRIPHAGIQLTTERRTAKQLRLAMTTSAIKPESGCGLGAVVCSIWVWFFTG